MSKSSSQPPMSLSRLRALIDAYGADLARMPAEERPAVEALLASDAEAAAWLAQASKLDAWLDSAELEPLSAATKARVAEIPIRHPRGPAARAGFGWQAALRFFAAGMAVCMLGVLSGLYFVPDDGGGDDGWDDVAQVAFATGMEEAP